MNTTAHEQYPDTHHGAYSKTVFGFWLYLLTDFVLFATILAVYFVLRNSTFGGPGAEELMPLSFTFIQTLVLLASAFTSGIANVAAHRNQRKQTTIFFALTFVLGSIFLWMSMDGFTYLIQEGNSWDRSAFLSAYFSLLGTHTLHVFFALLWILVLLPLVWLRGLTQTCLQRLTCLRLFWQFINVIWVGIFTMVYLMGVS